MPTFAILIDDGEYLGSTAEASYPNMFMALADTIRTAALIAAEREPMRQGEQVLTCEVRDNAIGEHRHVTVRFDSQHRNGVPVVG